MYEIALCFRLKPYIPPSTAAEPAAQETGFSWESVPVGSGGPCRSPQEGVGALDSFLRAAGKCLPRGSLSLNTSWFLALFGAFPLASCHRLWFLSGDLWGSQVLCTGQWRVLGGWAVNVPEQCWALQRRKKKIGKSFLLARVQCSFFLSVLLPPLIQATRGHLSAFKLHSRMRFFIVWFEFSQRLLTRMQDASVCACVCRMRQCVGRCPRHR